MGPGAVRNAKNSPRTGHTTDASNETPEAKRGAAVLPPRRLSTRTAPGQDRGKSSRQELRSLKNWAAV